MQYIQQQRAKFALDAVKQAADELAEKSKKEYQSYASALPFMIHANGLGPAAAFYRSKEGTHQKLYTLLSGWLTGKGQPLQGHKDLLAGLLKAICTPT